VLARCHVCVMVARIMIIGVWGELCGGGVRRVAVVIGS
jgi:hypothetical protein